jgi:glycosyltransferase involved in cell wall biosynthesis
MRTKKNARVLMIAPTPFFSDRGCHVRIFEEAKILQSLGYKVSLCTYHAGRDIHEIETHRIIRVPWYKKLSAGPSYHKFYIDLILLVYVIYHCLRNKPDIIHAHLHEGIVIGKIASLLFRLPLIADIQGSLTEELIQHRFIHPRGIMYHLFRLVERIVVIFPDVTLISSKSAFRNSPGWLRDAMVKAKLIIDGVDTDHFYPNISSDGLRARLGIPEKVKVVGYLGLLTDYQGVSVLIESIYHLVKISNKVHFLIMGYPNVEHYKEQVKRFGLEQFVTFTGRVPYEDAPRYLSVCDLAVSPKSDSTESNGKLMNYMAMGLPIIASNTSVNQEILGELGVYADVQDPTSFAQAMLQILSDDKRARSIGACMGEKARTEYSWRSLGIEISDIYQSMMSVCQPEQESELGIEESTI